jgi:hypothetical protein
MIVRYNRTQVNTTNNATSILKYNILLKNLLRLRKLIVVLNLLTINIIWRMLTCASMTHVKKAKIESIKC